MKYFRLIEEAHKETLLGYGTSGARWNKDGTPLIYASNYSAINLIEFLSIKGPTVTECNWILVELNVLGDIPYLDSNDLPLDWDGRPYPKSTQDFGTEWAHGQSTPYLMVPSCRIPISRYPEEHNLLINPLHPDRSALVSVVSMEKVSFKLNEWG